MTNKLVIKNELTGGLLFTNGADAKRKYAGTNPGGWTVALFDDALLAYRTVGKLPAVWRVHGAAGLV